MNDSEALDHQLDRIRKMNTRELKDLWQELYFKPAPAMHPNLLRMRLAWRVQEIFHGGLSKRANDALATLRRRIKNGRITRKRQEELPIGTRLTRDYHGERHNVLVVKNGFEYRGEIYTNLSRIAKVITGTHWNGPAFFGLRKEYND
ncbi:DUF2924 domain-containing protein [Kistimonas scapharcae]|uniref:DUF2924 domain-containing protein n=2 Tax=Kistimonas scapharcae TaxID=1036133 RepID=A0ABP8UV20_9GAMM